MRKIPLHHTFLLWLSIAIACGGLAAWSGMSYLEQQRQLIALSHEPQLVERIVAAHHLTAGTVLQESQLAIRSFPISSIASDSYEPAQYMSLLGKTLTNPIAAGDAFLSIHAIGGKKEAFSARLVPGRRALTISVDQINAIAGLLQAGDLIDLYVSFDYQRRKMTAPLLQGVLVLATDEEVDMGTGPDTRFSSTFSTVTLDLSPEDAAKLVAARQSGTITSMLRNPADIKLSSKAVRGDLATLLGVSAPAAEYKTIPVIYGNRSQKQIRAVDAIPNAVRSAVVDVLTPAQLSAFMEDDYVQEE